MWKVECVEGSGRVECVQGLSVCVEGSGRVGSVFVWKG